VLVGLVLALTLAGGRCAVTAEDPPPKKLTPQERKQLEAKWQEHAFASLRHAQAGKMGEATETVEKALDVARRLYPKQDHELLANSLTSLGVLYLQRGKYAEAEPLCREALAMYRRLYPKQDDPALAQSANVMTMVLRARAKYAEAESLC